MPLRFSSPGYRGRRGDGEWPLPGKEQGIERGILEQCCLRLGPFVLKGRGGRGVRNQSIVRKTNPRADKGEFFEGLKG